MCSLKIEDHSNKVHKGGIHFNAHFDKMLFLYLLIFVILFLKNSVVFFSDSSFERASLRGMCPLILEENFKIYPSNGAIWCAFVTKYFTCSFSFFLFFL